MWWVKIADFGISKRVGATALRTRIGTEAYLAPEVRGIYSRDSETGDEDKFSFAVDIWAIGIIAFRMITGRLPFPDGRQLFDYVVYGSSLPLGGSMNADLTKFITETMAASPRFRPTSRKASQYAWLQLQAKASMSLHSATRCVTCLFRMTARANIV